jgi:hypothetical protein
MSWEGAVFVGSGGGVRAGQRLSTSTLMQRPERDVTGVSTFSVIRYHAARPDPIIHSVPSHTSGRQLGTWIPGRTHATSGACPSLRARAEFNGGDEQLKYGYSEMNPRPRLSMDFQPRLPQLPHCTGVHRRSYTPAHSRTCC